MRAFIQKMPFVLVIFILVFSFSAPRETSAESLVSIPDGFLETDADIEAWKTFNDAMEIFESAYHRKLTGEELGKLFLETLLEKDPHTRFIPQIQEDGEQLRMIGEFGGAGMEVTPNPDGPGILVVSPIDDTPAARAGVRPKDVITHIDNASVEGLGFSEGVNLIRGEVGTDVTLTIVRESESNPIIITLTRDIIRIQFVKSELKEDGVGYVRITSFGEPVLNQMNTAIMKLVQENDDERLTGLVLDLRNNPGGLLDVADAVNDLFLDSRDYYDESGFYIRDAGVTISAERRGEVQPIRFARAPGDIIGGAPLVILVNSGSASASEIVAGVLQMHGRATIAGPKLTFGKGTVQTIIPISGGTLVITTSQYLIGQAGCEKPVQGLGITPDIILQSDAGDDVRITRRESDLDNSLLTSSVSDENCQYHREVSPIHRAAALRMLEIMELPVAPPPVFTEPTAE